MTGRLVPMRCATFALLGLSAVVLGTGACSRGSRPPDARPGRLVIERVGRVRQRLMDASASATYCRADSLLVIVALDRGWGAGLAVQTPFPAPAERAVRVLPALGDSGTAILAVRAVGDSVQAALVAASGTVTLSTGAVATGSFLVTLPPRDSGRIRERLVGAFRSLPTADTAAACGATARTP